MARIPRNTGKIFGVGGGAAPGGVGVFGSLGAGSPAYSIDPAVIQAAAAWAAGWGSAVVSDFPALEDLNSVPFVLSQQIAEILQDGIPPYDAGTTYFINSICSSGNLIYISLADNNIGNAPASSPASWSLISSNVFTGELVAPIIGASQNNYAPAGFGINTYNLILENNSGGNINITGLAFQTLGQVINITNKGTGANTITLKDVSGSSSAANRFYLNGADLVLQGSNQVGAPQYCVQLYYSNYYQGWMLLSKSF